MTKFIDDLYSPEWWIGVFIVGVLINLVSAYLKPRLDGFLSSISSVWARRSQEKQMQRKARIERMSTDPHEQVIAAIAGLRVRVRGDNSMISGFLLSFMAWGMLAFNERYISITLAVSAAIIFLIGIDDYFQSYRMEGELQEARKSGKESKSE